MTQTIRWMVKDRFGNNVYLTQERWEHIIESINHPEIEANNFIATAYQKEIG
jgi:hypothetical protein